MNPSDAIVVILDRPAQPGNIGAALRAMANMGQRQLRLVNPRLFPHPDAVDFAAGARQLLDGCQVFSDLSTAVADLNFLVATTNRSRGQRHTVVTPRQLGERMDGLLARPGTRVGLLFGTERAGLETVDLERADLICNIPTEGDHGSLNLAQAVLVVCYEVMLGRGKGASFSWDPGEQGVRAGADQMERLFVQMEEVLMAIEFIKPRQNRHMMGSLKALVRRAAPDEREVAILRGMMSEIVGVRQRDAKAWRKRLAEAENSLIDQSGGHVVTEKEGGEGDPPPKPS